MLPHGNLPCSWHCSPHSHILSDWTHITPFWIQGNWSTGRWSNLLIITELKSGRTGIWSQTGRLWQSKQLYKKYYGQRKKNFDWLCLSHCSTPMGEMGCNWHQKHWTRLKYETQGVLGRPKQQSPIGIQYSKHSRQGKSIFVKFTMHSFASIIHLNFYLYFPTLFLEYCYLSIKDAKIKQWTWAIFPQYLQEE